MYSIQGFTLNCLCLPFLYLFVPVCTCFLFLSKRSVKLKLQSTFTAWFSGRYSAYSLNRPMSDVNGTVNRDEVELAQPWHCPRNEREYAKY